MSSYVACIRWSLQDGDFSNGRYSRAHVWDFDGLPGVPASSSPQVVPLPWSLEQAVDPEEAFVASIASCHMLWFLSLASQAGLQVSSYQDRAEGRLARDEGGRMAMTDVWLRPRVVMGEASIAPEDASAVDSADAHSPQAIPLAERLMTLHQTAHQRCFIANSVRSRIHLLPEQSDA